MKKSIKNFISLITCAVLLLSTAQSGFTAKAQEQPPTVPNGSFEETQTVSSLLGKTTLPTKWTLKSNYGVSISTDVALSGNSVCISNSAEYTMTSQMITNFESGKYVFGYNCYAADAETTATITVKTYNTSGTLISEDTSQEFTASQNVWQKIYLSVEIDESETQAQIVITVKNTSLGCYVDDVYVEQSKENTVNTLEGASMRLNVNSPGIRFRGCVDKTLYDEYKSKFTNVCAGIIFTVEENLQNLSDFTVQELIANNRVYKDISAKIWNNEQTAKDDGYYGFNCAIINIREENILRKYCARSYLKYEIDGTVNYIYGNFSLSDNARSVKEIANLALEQNSEISEEQRKILEHFAYYGENN